MKSRLAFTAFFAGSMLAACNGWPHAPELQQVTTKPEKYPTYAAVQPPKTATVTFDNRRFTVTPTSVDLHGAKLESVGNAGNVAVYAPQGEQSPYSELYTPAGGTRWYRVVPIE
jgi:hypothetical protein